MIIFEGIQLLIVIIFCLAVWIILSEFIHFLSAVGEQMKGGTEADGRKSPLAVCDDPV